MEIDALITSVKELGELVKVSTPTIDIILALIQQRARIDGTY
jgi:2-dehydropantoate 2-reductase